MKKRTEKQTSADIRRAVRQQNGSYTHVDVRPSTPAEESLRKAGAANGPTMVMHHPDEFDADDVEAHHNIAVHLFQGIAKMPQVYGIMARLPESRAKEFGIQAAAAGFRLVDQCSLEEAGYSWWVYKR